MPISECSGPSGPSKEPITDPKNMFSPRFFVLHDSPFIQSTSQKCPFVPWFFPPWIVCIWMYLVRAYLRRHESHTIIVSSMSVSPDLVERGVPVWLQPVVVCVVFFFLPCLSYWRKGKLVLEVSIVHWILHHFDRSDKGICFGCVLLPASSSKCGATTYWTQGSRQQWARRIVDVLHVVLQRFVCVFCFCIQLDQCNSFWPPWGEWYCHARCLHFSLVYAGLPRAWQPVSRQLKATAVLKVILVN